MDRLQVRTVLNALAYVENSTLHWPVLPYSRLSTKNLSLKFNATLPIALRLLRPILRALPSPWSSLARDDVAVGRPGIKGITEFGCPRLA